MSGWPDTLFAVSCHSLSVARSAPGVQMGTTNGSYFPHTVGVYCLPDQEGYSSCWSRVGHSSTEHPSVVGQAGWTGIPPTSPGDFWSE